MVLPEADCRQLPHQTLHHHLYSVRQKKVSPKVICHFLSNHLEFFREILHVYYFFIHT